MPSVVRQSALGVSVWVGLHHCDIVILHPQAGNALRGDRVARDLHDYGIYFMPFLILEVVVIDRGSGFPLKMFLGRSLQMLFFPYLFA